VIRRPKTNVLFLCADQWRGDCLSALGHPVVRTPNLDALASDGVLFRNHFGQCTPCGPSRTSLLTGLYLMNHRSGRNGTPQDWRHTNIALEARKAGHEPALFGYTDSGVDPRGKDPSDPALTGYDRGVMPGFTTPLHMTEDMDPWVADLVAKGYPLPKGRADVFRAKEAFEKPTGRGHRYIPPAYSAEDSDTAFVADEFLKWLSIRETKPWFAHVVFMRPHPPLIAPEPYNALHDPASVPFPPRAATPHEEKEQHPFLAYALSKLERAGAYDEHNPLNLLTASELEIRQMRAAYYGLIAEVDFHIGRIVDYLKETGQYERTLIVFTSDHAEVLGQHYFWGKEVYFDQSFHVPLIIRDPDAEANAARGTVVEAFSEAIDVMPTLVDWMGLDVPRACDGRSLLPFLRGKPPESWRSEVFFEHDFRDVAGQRPEAALGLSSDDCSYAVIRGDHYKYVHFARLPPLLFDLRRDPHETTNLAASAEAEGIMLRYVQKMLTWRLTHADRTMSNMYLGKDGLISRP
jgi:arylsulfatase A-like enzyme